MKHYIPKKTVAKLYPNQHAFSMSTNDLLALTNYLVHTDFKVTVDKNGMSVEKENQKLWSLKYCKSDGLFYIITEEENKQDTVAEVILKIKEQSILNFLTYMVTITK